MRAGLSFALLSLAACVAPAAVPEGQSEEVRRYTESLAAEFAAPGVVTARLGQSVRIGDAGVRPIAVTEDSRCPHDVECVWAGRLKLRVAISGVAGERELTLREPYGLPSGGTLTLVAAAPAPWRSPPPGVERGPANRFGFRRD
jgi:hypothetical protein